MATKDKKTLRLLLTDFVYDSYIITALRPLKAFPIFAKVRLYKTGWGIITQSALLFKTSILRTIQ